jgi:hypothetical protein
MAAASSKRCCCGTGTRRERLKQREPDNTPAPAFSASDETEPLRSRPDDGKTPMVRGEPLSFIVTVWDHTLLVRCNVWLPQRVQSSYEFMIC